ncbi:MAG: hypothetical protein IAG13_03970 [Deltaproteobacteria bacterium]|nr:hypothetical protein [Nannocystaceae bacterium]
MIAKPRVVKVVLGLVLVLAAAAAFGALRFAQRRDRVYPVEAMGLTVSDDAERIARGRHLAHSVAGCAYCHGEDLGGQVLDDNGMVRLVASNLTPGEGGVVEHYTDDDWVRAILEGVDPRGRALWVMPSAHLRFLADSDVAAIVAYCRQLAPVDRVLPRSDASVLARIMTGLTGGEVWSVEEIDHELARPATPPPVAADREYGTYLIGSCLGCHGNDRKGGKVVHPGAPPSADISPRAMTSWTEDELRKTLSTGVRPDGSHLDPGMPWQVLRELDDVELRALWLALEQG